MSRLARYRSNHLPDDQRSSATDPAPLFAAGLSEAELSDPTAVARILGSTVLIGATGCSGAFSESLVRAVAANDPAPIVLPLSNPGSCAEARAEDILAWTEGQGFVATGSPSIDVDGPVGRRVIGQANNVFIFPGVGLGAIVAQARQLSDDAFLVAARTLADLVTDDRLREGAIYPAVGQLRTVARQIAIAVVRYLRDSGDGLPYRDDEIAPAVDAAMWWPEYEPYVPAG
ncbi:MAG: malic enzyme-like NAD(P)-binding protein [Chloroflexota bacterium]